MTALDVPGLSNAATRDWSGKVDAGTICNRREKPAGFGAAQGYERFNAAFHPRDVTLPPQAMGQEAACVTASVRGGCGTVGVFAKPALQIAGGRSRRQRLRR
ncbi:hypothetical protein [Antarctobacter sp.]|uniref:hypothetical protein n=1 Tax=Antarctobacter sp. TaxID=1872577 RepID=UPI003A922199